MKHVSLSVVAQAELKRDVVRKAYQNLRYQTI